MKNQVLKLLVDAKLNNGIEFKAGQELEIVMAVVYINGNMLMPSMQASTLEWIKANPTLFKDVTRNW